MAANPIEQRIEMIADEWAVSKSNRSARLIRITSKPDEEDMVDTFFTYMVAVDTPILDIAFHFESQYTDDEEFSKSLLNELDETITVWNTSKKEEGIDFEEIDWKPDYDSHLVKEYGWAGVFTYNFNRLSKILQLHPDNYTVAILKNTNTEKAYLNWLTKCLQYGIDDGVRYVVADTTESPVYERLYRENESRVLTLRLNLNMPLAMEQIASMIPPDEPSALYRKSFVGMMNAMGAEKEKEAENFGKICISEAENLLVKDPYWVTQLVVVYTALANDKIRYKKKQEVLNYADKAIAAAVASENRLDRSISESLIAQALMFRGTVYYTDKEWDKSYEDYHTAYEIYYRQKSTVNSIEAARMSANAGFRCGKTEESMRVLSQVIKSGETMDKEIAMASSFRLVIDLFMDKSYEKYLGFDELQNICRPLFGEDWQKVVRSWNKPPGKDSIIEMEKLTNI